MYRFSRTDISRSRVSCCGTTPSRARICGPSVTGSRPRMRSVPSVIGETQPIIRIVELLPAPLGPRNPNASPRSTSKSTASTAVKFSNRLVSPRARISGRLGTPMVGSAAPFAAVASTSSDASNWGGQVSRPGSDRSVGSEPVIRLDDVSKVYPAGARPALEKVSVDIDKGEFVFLIGPSGSGKSTVLRLLLREELPTKGTVVVDNRNVGKMPNRKVPDLRRRIGCVFQDFRLLPKKNVFENVAFALEVINKSPRVIRRTVPEVLDLVGLTGKAQRRPGELSGGEQQRVAIARAFVNKPLVLLADEPTGNLDPDTSQGIMSLLERINRIGTTVLMATHDNNIVDAMRRRVVELDSGRVIRDQNRGVYGVGR